MTWDYDPNGTRRCQMCGEEIPETDGYGYKHFICMDCINERKNDIQLLMDATKDDWYEIEIPALARYMLSDREINDLLVRELNRKLEVSETYAPAFDTSNFIKDYKNDIAELIGEGE